MAEPRYRVGVIGTGRIASTIQDEVVDQPLFVPPAVLTRRRLRRPSGNRDRGRGRSRMRSDATHFGERWSVDRLYADYQQMLSDGRARYRQRLRADASPRRGDGRRLPRSGVRGVFMEKPHRPHPARSGRHDRGHRPGGHQGGRQSRAHLRSLLPARSLVDRDRRPSVACAASWPAGTKGCRSAARTSSISCASCSGSEARWVFGHLDRGLGSSIREEVA